MRVFTRSCCFGFLLGFQKTASPDEFVALLQTMLQASLRDIDDDSSGKLTSCRALISEVPLLRQWCSKLFPLPDKAIMLSACDLNNLFAMEAHWLMMKKPSDREASSPSPTPTSTAATTTAPPTMSASTAPNTPVVVAAAAASTTTPTAQPSNASESTEAKSDRPAWETATSIRKSQRGFFKLISCFN